MARVIITRDEAIADQLEAIANKLQLRIYRDLEGLWSANSAARDALRTMLENLDAGADIPTTGSWTKTPAGWGVAIGNEVTAATGQKVIVANRYGVRELVTLAAFVKDATWHGSYGQAIKVAIFEVEQ